MIVLDASVLIAHLDARDRHHAKTETLLKATGAEPLGSSAITLVETLVAPARGGKLVEAVHALDRLGVTDLDLGADAPRRLAVLRATTSRKLPDCSVLAAAQEHEGAVASFDHELIKTTGDLGLKTIR